MAPSIAPALTQQLLTEHFGMTSFPVSGTPSRAGSEASSGMPPAKRAKVMKTPVFGEIDFEKITLNAYKLGNGKTSYTPLVDGVRARFDLTPPGALVFSNWGFETNYNLSPEKKPSFLGGPANTKAEHLEINVELNEAQAAFVDALDKKVSGEFGKAAKSAWHPAVKISKDGVSMLKVPVQLTGDDLAALKVVDEGVFHKGSGWPFLQPWMAKTRNFGPCKAKVVVTAVRVWEVGGRAGLFFQASELTLMSVAKPRPQFESAQADEDAMMADFGEEDA